MRIARADNGAEETIRCRWLFGATGYYDYSVGYRPNFAGEEAFAGPILHPQQWPEGFDAAGKRIAVIGSGATAVILVPVLAETAAHVTQIQRTPSYVLPMPSEDAIANVLWRWLSLKRAHAIVRRKNILRQQWFYALCRRYPRAGYPWEMTFSYASDERPLTRGAVIDPAMRLSPAPAVKTLERAA